MATAGRELGRSPTDWTMWSHGRTGPMTRTARLGSWSRLAKGTLIARGMIGGWQTKGPGRRFCASDLGLCGVERVTRIELA